jgi:hypothetical protein
MGCNPEQFREHAADCLKLAASARDDEGARC